MSPELSVILAARGGYGAVQRTVECLKRQSSADRIELIVIACGDPAAVPFEDVRRFAGYQGLSLDGGASVAVANAAGVRHARAPLVAFAEDHCFPEPDWAAALIDAHRGSYAVVGPAFRNVNPGSTVSWCDFLIGYSPWMEPTEAGLRPFLPGHNSSYKRCELLAYGDRLEDMLESETVLHFDLVRRGRTLFIEPKARVAHVNFAVFPVWIRVQFHCGRVFGGFRAAGWSLPHRLLYAAASPAIPFVRFLRVVGELLAPGRPTARLGQVTPLLMLGLATDGVGQFFGYLFGPGRSRSALAGYEHNRIRFIPESDRRDLDRQYG